ncbi:hypothetical protein [Tropicimonas sp. IMCC6043]|uniref:hypothetical protein n=1 Tax=Tropicimonas sp. IMCC6043 TaxID=2510645 RepID=UPI00101CF505|nr:hypothetical protein [Tropicimonas sp. IMCC6043]RYH06731.1 hypothetical protein EU800_22765 [Tropicimonas sp. IMCC6043]
MIMNFPVAAAATIVSIAILGLATQSNGESASNPAAVAEQEGRTVKMTDLRIKTDDYLVPAHICADVDAEKYEDCVPWSHVGENVIYLLPEVE